VYYCGKELLRFDDNIKTLQYTILVIDYEECCCADVYSDGEIKVLFQERSFVDGKMRVGGQSAKRFAQNRDNAITLWFKKIDKLLMELKDKEIYLGISFVYKNRFINTLHTYNKQKIKKINKTEYTNITGIYQFINKLESKKNMTDEE